MFKTLNNMKKLLRFISFICVAITVLVTAYSFRKYQQIKTKTDILRELMVDNFFQRQNQENGKGWMVDSTIVIETKNNWGTYYSSPISYCGNSPAYFKSSFVDAIRLKDTSSEYSRIDFDKSFKMIYKKDVRKPSFTKNAGFNEASYNGDALLAAFKENYIKPTENIDGILMGKVYNIALKAYARSCAIVMVDILKNKAAFIQQTNLYKAKALANKQIDGIGFCTKASDVILGKKYYDEKVNPNPKECVGYYYDRIVGMMMRRQLDGSLPAVMKCITTVLKDYDPEFYETVKTKLVL